MDGRELSEYMRVSRKVKEGLECIQCNVHGVSSHIGKSIEKLREREKDEDELKLEEHNSFSIWLRLDVGFSI